MAKAVLEQISPDIALVEYTWASAHSQLSGAVSVDVLEVRNDFADAVRKILSQEDGALIHKENLFPEDKDGNYRFALNGMLSTRQQNDLLALNA